MFLYVLLISILITSIKIYTRPFDNTSQTFVLISNNARNRRQNTRFRRFDLPFLISICLNHYVAIVAVAAVVVATNSTTVVSFLKSICVFHQRSKMKNYHETEPNILCVSVYKYCRVAKQITKCRRNQQPAQISHLFLGFNVNSKRE